MSPFVESPQMKNVAASSQNVRDRMPSRSVSIAGPNGGEERSGTETRDGLGGPVRLETDGLRTARTKIAASGKTSSIATKATASAA